MGDEISKLALYPLLTVQLRTTVACSKAVEFDKKKFIYLSTKDFYEHDFVISFVLNFKSLTDYVRNIR